MWHSMRLRPRCVLDWRRLETHLDGRLVLIILHVPLGVCMFEDETRVKKALPGYQGKLITVQPTEKVVFLVCCPFSGGSRCLSPHKLLWLPSSSLLVVCLGHQLLLEQ